MMLEKRIFDNDGNDNKTNAVLKKYIYSNHLQSASLELDEIGAIISYEEYHPYGTTSYQAMNASIKATAKRYRYTGKEKDEESGLYYHGARYYVPWLARWTVVDPLEGKYAGMSPYNYCANNPVKYRDDDGREIKFMGYIDKEKAPMTKEQAKQVWDDMIKFMEEQGIAEEYKALEKSKKIYEIYFFSEDRTNLFTANQDFRTGKELKNFNSVIEVNPWQNVRFKNYLQSGIEGVLHEIAHAYLYDKDSAQYFIERQPSGSSFGSRHEERVIIEFEFKYANKLWNPLSKIRTRGTNFEGNIERAKTWRVSWDKRDGSMPQIKNKEVNKESSNNGMLLQIGDKEGIKTIDYKLLNNN